MNKVKSFFQFGILILFIAFANKVNSQHTTPCEVENNSFNVGEKLTYQLFYNWKFVWVPAGEITFEVFDEGDNYRMEGIGKTYSSYDNFFRVRDFYQVTISKEQLEPITFVRHIEEGGYRKFDSLYFNHDKKEIQSFNGKTKDVAKQESYPMSACMIDLMTVLYKLRNIDTEKFSPGEYIDFEMFFDKEVYPIHVVYEGNEKKKIKNLGKFECLKIKPELIVGEIFKEDDEMSVWVSNDKNKIPLMIESPISVGSVKGILKSYEGLRYKLESKIE